MAYLVLTNKEMTTESHRCNCFTRNGGNAIPKHASSEAKDSNPTTGLVLLWARIPFRGNFNHSQVSRKEARQIFFNDTHTHTHTYICWNISILYWTLVKFDECYAFHTAEDLCVHSNCSKSFDGCPHLMALELMCAVLYTHAINLINLSMFCVNIVPALLW